MERISQPWTSKNIDRLEMEIWPERSSQHNLRHEDYRVINGEGLIDYGASQEACTQSLDGIRVQGRLHGAQSLLAQFAHFVAVILVRRVHGVPYLSTRLRYVADDLIEVDRGTSLAQLGSRSDAEAENGVADDGRRGRGTWRGGLPRLAPGISCKPHEVASPALLDQ